MRVLAALTQLKRGHSKHKFYNMKYNSIALLALMVGIWSCGSVGSIQKQGIKKFENGEYDLAIKDLQKAAAASVAPAQTNYYIAEAYRMSDRSQLAAPYYQKAIDAGAADPDARFHYAFALKSAGQYTEAAKQLEQYIQTKPLNKVYSEKANRELFTLRGIDDIIKIKSFYELKPLEKINTAGAEFAPIVLGKELIFTASRKDKIYKTNGLPMLGLYKTQVSETGEVSGGAVLFSNSILAGEANEGTPTFSKDGKTVVFARGNTGKRKGTADVDLYVSRLVSGTWTAPRMIPVSDSLAWDGSPAFSADGKTIYFASNRQGGVGGLDIYRTNMDASGRFSKPVNMGKDINTPGNEIFPIVGPDAKLYFASDGHPGLGKLDLFVATRSQGVIGIDNMGAPFNTRFDDFGLAWLDEYRGFFASNRDGGKGDDDVYLFEDTRVNLDSIQLAKLDPKDPRFGGNLDIGTPKLVNYYLSGIVTTNEAPTTPLDSATVQVFEIGDDGTETLIGEGKTREKGKFGTYKLQEGKEYSISVVLPKFLNKREAFSMAGRNIPPVFLKKPVTDTTFVTEIKLDNNLIGTSFVLDNIYYDLNKANIRNDAAPELDKVVTVMKANPTLKIELSSHTDARDTDAYNQTLSQRRAESAVNYILSKGIEPDRIVAKGYGERQLIIKNAKTEEEHQKNRRTEITILEL